MPSSDSIQVPDPSAALNAWASTPLRDRIAWLRRFRMAIADHEAQLCDLACQELGKVRFEALTGDILPLLAACKWLEKNAARALAPRRARDRAFWQVGQKHWFTREPLGTVAIIATWNYPVQLLGVQLIQALIAGNTVVVKPSERSPLTQARLMELAVSCGLPRGTLSWVPATREAGASLLSDHRFDHVIFTGSTSVGREIARTLAPSLTPSTLELSGRDSAIVLDDADADLAASVIWTGVVFNAGQTCLAPKRAIVHRAVYAEFLRALAPRVAGTPVVTLVDEASANLCHAQSTATIAAGGRSVTGTVEPPAGREFRPVAVVDCPADSELVGGRNFGPTLGVVVVDSLEEALAVHHHCDQHLSTSVFTRNLDRARALAPRLRAATVLINDSLFPTCQPATSITGLGQSGWGASRGIEGLLTMTRSVTVSITRTPFRVNTQPLPATWVDKAARLVRWWYGTRNAAHSASRGPASNNRAAAGSSLKPPSHTPLPAGSPR